MIEDRTYRLYHLTGSGVICGAVNRSFDDDAEALEHADRRVGFQQAVEIWQTDRMVGRVERHA